MKGILLLAITFIATGCCCTNQYVQYRSVAVAPVAVRPVVRPVIVAPVVEPVIVGYPGPMDVTTTTIDYY